MAETQLCSVRVRKPARATPRGNAAPALPDRLEVQRKRTGSGKLHKRFIAKMASFGRWHSHRDTAPISVEARCKSNYSVRRCAVCRDYEKRVNWRHRPGTLRFG